MNFFHQTFCIPKTIQVVRLQAIQTIRMPNTIHQLVRFQAIQTLYHTLVEREVFSVKSALGINIFWVKKGL